MVAQGPARTDVDLQVSGQTCWCLELEDSGEVVQGQLLRLGPDGVILASLADVQLHLGIRVDDGLRKGRPRRDDGHRSLCRWRWRLQLLELCNSNLALLCQRCRRFREAAPAKTTACTPGRSRGHSPRNYT